MRKNNQLLRGAIAAALGFTAGSAIAGGLTGGAVVTYAAAGITSAATGVTVPSAPGPVYVLNAGSLNTGSTLTFTLSGSAQFANPPVANINAGNAATIAQTGGGSNSTFVTYTITGNASQGTTISLGQAVINNANSALGTSVSCATPNTVTMTMSGGYGGGSTDTLPSGTAAVFNYAASCNPLIGSYLPTASATDNRIDVSSGATEFVASGSANVSAASVGMLTVSIGRATAANGTDPTSLASLSALVGGSFAGISRVALSTTSCSAYPTGSVASVSASGSSATVGIALGGTTQTSYNVCLVASGGQMQPSSTYTVTPSVKAASTGFSYTNAGSSLDLGSLTLSGSAISSNYNVSGDVGSYASYITVTNTEAVAQTIYASIVYEGVNYFDALPDAIPASTSVLLPVADIISAVGAPITGDGTRFSITLYSTGSSLSGGGLLVNPDGTVSSMPGVTNR